jgi:hypothetical protein
MKQKVEVMMKQNSYNRYKDLMFIKFPKEEDSSILIRVFFKEKNSCTYTLKSLNNRTEILKRDCSSLNHDSLKTDVYQSLIMSFNKLNICILSVDSVGNAAFTIDYNRENLAPDFMQIVDSSVLNMKNWVFLSKNWYLAKEHNNCKIDILSQLPK